MTTIRMTSTLRASLLKAALLTAATQLPSHAANLYWDANGATAGSGNASGTWDTGFNWTADPEGTTPQVGWTDGSGAVFAAGTDGVNYTVTVEGTVVTPLILIEEAGNTVTLAGGTIEIGGGVIDTSALGPDTNRNVVISSSLSGEGGLTIRANGSLSAAGDTNSELDLTGDNTFIGTLTITSGIVSWNDDKAFGDFDNDIVLDGGGLVDTNRNLSIFRDLTIGSNGGTLRAYGNANTYIEGDLKGSGTLYKTDGGGLTLVRDDYTFTGAVEILGGSVRIGDQGEGSLTTASAINIGANGALWIRRTDGANVSSLIPSTINFAAAGSLIDFNPPAQDATLTLDRDLGGSTTVGALRVSGGTLSLAPGTDVEVSQVRIGLQNAENRGVLQIGTGSTLTTAFFDVGQQANNSGTIQQTGGTVELVPGGNGFRIGHWNNGTNPGSVYNLSGGTFDATALETNTGSARLVNVGWDGQGDMIVGGGATTATLKAFGIQLDANGDSTGYSDNLTLATNGRIELGAGNLASASANDRFYLDGGTLAATANTTISAPTTVNAAGGTFDVDGSTLTLSGEIAGTGTIQLTDTSGGGAVTINTGTGTRPIAANLAGSVQLNKNGTGTLILTGANTHSGEFLINEGTLTLEGSIASNVLDFNGGTALRGEGSVGGDLSLGFGGSGATLTVDPTTPGALSVAGDVTLNGTNTIVPTSPFEGTVAALTYSGVLNASNGEFTIAGMENYRSLVIDTSVAGQINLTNANADLTWTGTGGSVWNLKSTPNWSNNGSDAFHWGDKVLFDDSATENTVNLAGELSPNAIVVDSSNDYSFVGGAGNFISGIGSLLKQGPSTLTIDAPNTFSGGTVISEGTIRVRQAGALGGGTVILGDENSGSSPVALYLDANRVNFGNRIEISGNGNATIGSLASVTGSGDNNQFTNIVLNGDVTFDSHAGDRTDYENITGTGDITVTGTGRSIFPTTPANWTGDLTVNASGGLQIGVASTAGNRVPDSSNLTIGEEGLVRLSTTAETIAGLFGTGTLEANAPSGGTATLTVGFGDADGEFDGTIQNGSGTVAITKIGEGTQTLLGTNVHTGRTTISGGTLAIDGEEALGAAPASLVEDQLLINGGILKALGSVTIDDAFRGISTGGATFEVDADETLAISSPFTGTGQVTKTGEGLLTSTGGSWTGLTTVEEGTLRMLAKSGTSDYVVQPDATLELGYSTGQNYNTGVVVHGSGVDAPTGLHLAGGIAVNFQRNGGLRLATAPTTIRSYGEGTASLQGFDVNGIHLTVDPEASGSVIDANVGLISGSYGYRMNVAAGDNTATGDLVINGPLSGGGNVERSGIPVNFQKYGTGSLKVNGESSYTGGIWLREGTVILGGDERLSPAAGVAFGDGVFSGKLVLNGFSQTVADLNLHNGNLESSIVGGAATRSTLTVNYNGEVRAFSGTIGGAGQDGNLELVKSGEGTLALDGTLAYSGDTTVNEGTLSLASASLADGANVNLNGAGTLDLAFDGTDTVASLLFDGVPQATGTWGSPESGAEHTDARFTGTGILLVSSATSNPYTAWETANGVTGGPEGDSDGDGIPNALEFVLGSNPNANSASDLPTATISEDGLYIDFVFRRSDASLALAGDQQPYVEYGSDLSGWTTAVHDGTTVIIGAADDDFYAPGVDRVTVRLLRSALSANGKFFVRLGIDLP